MTAGRVSVNGIVATELGTKIDPRIDLVTVDGKVVAPGSGAIYLMLNKPTGVLTTMDDPHGRPTVAQLVADANAPGLFPVGRLDMDTSGLLLFTTDGDIGYQLTHPKFERWKTYQIKTAKKLSAGELKTLAEGVHLDDGMTVPARAAYGSDGVLILSIREGRNRQVRRMFEALRHPVLSLHRTEFAGLKLGSLAPGAWRHFHAREIVTVTGGDGQLEQTNTL
jgi:23S rRNA pseudouridine2605 synthase